MSLVISMQLSVVDNIIYYIELSKLNYQNLKVSKATTGFRTLAVRYLLSHRVQTCFFRQKWHTGNTENTTILPLFCCCDHITKSVPEPPSSVLSSQKIFFLNFCLFAFQPLYTYFLFYWHVSLSK